jgi:glutamine synthetase
MIQSSKKAFNRIRKEKAKFLTLQLTDLLGRTRSRLFPADSAQSILQDGFAFDGSSITGFMDISESDMVARPDPTTLKVLPWTAGDEKSVQMTCDVHRPNGKPFEGDPRFILRRAIDECRKMGFVPMIGPEEEFTLLNEADRKPVDYALYMDYQPYDPAEAFKMELLLVLRGLGLQPEVAHHEIGPGQNEINFQYSDALSSADHLLLFKQAVKILAKKRGMIATFMAKPFFGYGAHGAHRHVSLRDLKSGRNLFFDKKAPKFLSSTAQMFIGGILNHARSLSALAAPTVNSYKRLVPGLEAPIYLTWGWGNRSVLVKVPAYFPRSASAARIEFRGTDSSSNPYLDFSGVLMAGLDGIKRSADPGPDVSENVYHMSKERVRELGIGLLPSSLHDALDDFKKDPLMRETLGEYAYTRYIKLKETEWAEYEAEIGRTGDPGIQISEWELNRYLLTS